MNDSTALKRILIIDDDSDFRKLLLLRLGKVFAGVELEDYDPIARGVPEADFDWSRYDVLLLGYFLCIHGVTGLDILRKNRKDPRFPATIMLTGAGSEEIAVRALKSGVSDYIRKETLDEEELRKSILNAYEESKVERQRINSEATLNIAALEIRRAFEEKPAVQTFQPIISLIASEEENTAELYNISLNLIDTSGTTLSAEEIYSRVGDIPAFHKYIHRWMLREAIGRRHLIQLAARFIIGTGNQNSGRSDYA